MDIINIILHIMTFDAILHYKSLHAMTQLSWAFGIEHIHLYFPDLTFTFYHR